MSAILLSKDILINVLPYCNIETLISFYNRYEGMKDILNLQVVLSKLVIQNQILSKGVSKKI